MNRIAPDTRYGPLVYNDQDPFFRTAIERYGEWSWSEAIVWQAIVVPGSVVISAGANIGCHVVALAQLVGKQGAVFAFEPQFPLWQTTIANTVLCNVNPWVRVFHAALGAGRGTIHVPRINYEQENTFGGLSFKHTHIPDDAERDPVPLMTLDALHLPRCDFIQLDIEGMEPEALDGARDTIERCKPLLYLEVQYEGSNEPLSERLVRHGYNAWLHHAPLYSPLNYRSDPENAWPDTVSTSWLCAPSSMDMSHLGLAKVQS